MTPAEMFDDDLLDAFMDSFYGSGHYTAPYWFVGMEEGGHGTFREVAGRLAAWHAGGRRELHELGDANAPWFGPRATLQRTWAKLIHTVLSAEGQPVDREAVREYQRTRLGRRAGFDCLLELLPLPSPSTGEWLYSRYSGLPHLVSRDAYREYWAERRANHIRERIAQHQPRAVVFYSVNPTYQHWWKRIAALPFAPPRDGLQVAQSSSTLFIITRHPRGQRNAHFDAIGRLIAAEIQRAGEQQSR
jgi:hypothetical protein